MDVLSIRLIFYKLGVRTKKSEIERRMTGRPPVFAPRKDAPKNFAGKGDNARMIRCNPCDSKGMYRTFPMERIVNARRAICARCVDCVCYEVEFEIEWENSTFTWEPLSHCLNCFDEIMTYLKASNFSIFTYNCQTAKKLVRTKYVTPKSGKAKKMGTSETSSCYEVIS